MTNQHSRITINASASPTTTTTTTTTTLEDTASASFPPTLGTTNGPEQRNIVRALGKFFFKCSLLLCWTNLIFAFRFHLWYNDAATPKTTTTATTATQTQRREQLLAGWERVQLQTARTATRHWTTRNEKGTTTRQRDEDTTGDKGEVNPAKKSPRDVDVSWATGKFFFSFLVSFSFH